MEELLSLSATTLVQRVRAREVTPAEVLEAHIKRIETINPALNAVVTPMFDQAREQAQAATELIAKKANEIPSLFGLPITVKDALPVAGFRFTAGAMVHRDRVAAADAEAVRRLKAAGAIIMGKTNCPAMSSSVETNNLLFGLTRNPWDLDRSAGGSSGGEGAIIAASGSPLGLGSDVAGSVRIPAAFCGICALKPSAGRISTRGHDPAFPPSIAHWNTVGPLARRVEDLALALSVLSETPVRDYKVIDLRGSQILVPKLLSIVPVKPEIKSALQKSLEVLGQAGMEVIESVKLPFYELTFEMAAILTQQWSKNIRRELGSGQPIQLIPEMFATWRGKGTVALNTLVMLFMTDGYGRLARMLGYGDLDRVAELRSQVVDIMGANRLMLWPVYPTPALKHGFSWGIYGIPSYTPLFNILGFPSVAVPVGLSAQGLPLGLQVVGLPGDDEIAIAAAAMLEKAFGGWLLPPIGA